jgi:type IV pilus assembly protein PilB
MSKSKIGELLIRSKLISKKQLDQALSEQQQHSQSQPIGQILCQMGLLKKADLDRILDNNKKRLMLGEILVLQQLIDEKMLEIALNISKDKNIPLGKTLLKQHLLDEGHLARAIALQHDLEVVSLTDMSFDPKLSGFVNLIFAKCHQIVPIRFSNESLTIAMACPIQHDELLQLEKCCNLPIIPVIAKESEIVIAQQKIYNIDGTNDLAEIHVELSEDRLRESGKSQYVGDYISADIDYLVKRIIIIGIQDGASDIHAESTENGMDIRYRLDGILHPMDLGANVRLVSAKARQIVSKIKILCDMDISERRRPQDSSFKMKVSKDGSVRSVDFRVSTVPTQFGENVVIRILDKRSGAISLNSLGYFPNDISALHSALDKPTGIFLVTGPTGSGKSSTLYAVLSHINTPGVKTLTIEDPIEYGIKGITQTEVNEIIGNTFARLLRAFLRQDPDNIMVGEIRDLETATISMRAALTGHTVLSTLHTNDATSAVTRLVDMGVDPSLISTTLRCVMAQRLVRNICRKCSAPYTPPEPLVVEFGIPAKNSVEFFQGRGCPSCKYTGFKGRLPIVELWIPTRDELLMFNRRPDNLTLRSVVFSQPERLTMIEDGFRRVRAGETTLEELLRVVPYEQIEAGRLKAPTMFT